jgi:hypothetical protein
MRSAACHARGHRRTKSRFLRGTPISAATRYGAGTRARFRIDSRLSRGQRKGSSVCAYATIAPRPEYRATRPARARRPCVASFADR